MVISIPRLQMLYTNIGRGHPFYLDGIAEALIRRGQVGLVRSQTDVFEVSRLMARLGWKAARWLYRKGSSGGVAGAVYSRLRRSGDYNRPGLGLRIMGRDIKRKFFDSDNPLLVAHPTLVGILAGRPGLFYQHGELVAPAEALVRGAETVFVPTAEVAEAFLRAGYPPGSIDITGLCIEPSIARQAADAFTVRQKRYLNEPALTGAFFSSGAEPSAHIEILTLAAVSALRHGGRVILVGRRGGAFLRLAVRKIVDHGIGVELIDATDGLPARLPDALVVQHDSRREENAFAGKLFASFDYFVAPAHERSNWALGLGLPIFIIEPAIGSFAAMNRENLLAHGVAEVIANRREAYDFGKNLSERKSDGTLSSMAAAGYGHYPIDGFSHIAGYLVDRFAG